MTDRHKYEVLTREQVRSLLDQGHLLTGATLYEPDHAPRGTRFIIWEGRGLYRVRYTTKGTTT